MESGEASARMPAPRGRLRVSPYAAGAAIMVAIMAVLIAYPMLRMILRAFTADGALNLQEIGRAHV